VKKIDKGLDKGHKRALSYRIYDKKWTKVENRTEKLRSLEL